MKFMYTADLLPDLLYEMYWILADVNIEFEIRWCTCTMFSIDCRKNSKKQKVIALWIPKKNIKTPEAEFILIFFLAAVSYLYGAFQM